MAKKSFLPKDDEGKLLWLNNFAAKLSGYATKYGITAAEITDMEESEEYFNYWFIHRNQEQEFTSKLTAYKNELRDGVKAGGTPSVMPVPPAPGVAPTAVAPGIFPRATSIGNRIKAHASYTLADGNDLGLEGAEDTIDTVNIKPVLEVILNAGVPRIKWKKQGTDGIEIQVMRNGTPYIFLAIDTVPDYDDTFPLPAAGQSAVWKYKAIYRLADERIGQWSDEVSVTVMG